MTDLTPNDLSHLSDEEFLALCPQGEHAPGPEPLSPDAEAVLDAMYEVNMDFGDENAKLAAAAIRALADQAIPMIQSPWSSTFVPVLTAMESREKMLAIATELEGQ